MVWLLAAVMVVVVTVGSLRRSARLSAEHTAGDDGHIDAFRRHMNALSPHARRHVIDQGRDHEASPSGPRE